MRITRHQMFMEMARAAAKRSTCFRNNVGAVVVYKNRVISIGYNGSAPGEEHCLGNDCPVAVGGGCSKSIHAEANAIKFIPRALPPDPLTLYCTHSPCVVCADKIANQGRIESLYYEHEYRLTAGKDELLLNGIGVYRITPAGYVLDQATNCLVVPE